MTECRPLCGACCIAPAIAQPFWGMPEGKPAGMACVHLSTGSKCELFGDPRRPSVCAHFLPEPSVCGDSREEALNLLTLLETRTAPHCYD
jgi:hypothetical protein